MLDSRAFVCGDFKNGSVMMQNSFLGNDPYVYYMHIAKEEWQITVCLSKTWLENYGTVASVITGDDENKILKL